ncbi:MAG: glycosyltransferase family 4 protein [Methanolobus sp.]|uniref:glycosyltransferase family 4 protein n=1 Tax=Methanolobus sp. TaxID=1874737 RepID=UPI002731CC74|nr:glycosyltransferase family 4 protein [Methanolobus sp.]MDP2218374.1 glycosyltransferase family 4 protein [Methanolobus sp.]
MKIAFVTFEYPPHIIGGAGVYAQNVVQELVKLGHEVTVFTPAMLKQKTDFSNMELKINYIRLHEKLPLKALQFWLYLPKEIKRAHNNDEFDLIHFNGISYWFLKSKIVEVPHVVTIHHLVKSAIKNNSLPTFTRLKKIGSENNLFITSIEKKCVESADYIIAVSEFTKKEIVSVYSVNSTKVKTIYNGIDLNKVDVDDDEIKSIKSELGIADKKILLFVGRINDPRKGLTFLLESFKLVLERQNVVLLVVGKGDQTDLKEIVRLMGISQNVIFTGFVDEEALRKYYSVCDIYVCPSKLEGFGLTLLEAMLARKPIVATNVGAIPEIIENTINGIIVESGNTSAMADAIYMLLQNELMVERMGKDNYIYLNNNFGWQKCATEISNVYANLK